MPELEREIEEFGVKVEATSEEDGHVVGVRAITAGLTSNPLADKSVAFPSGYKQTAVGAIPQDWKTARIDVHASIKTGSRNTQDKKDDGKYPFFVRSQPGRTDQLLFVRWRSCFDGR